MADSILPEHDDLDASIEHREHRAYHSFTVGGYKVPYLKGYLIDGENTWNLLLDERFGMTCTDQELQQWLWFLSNAMAVAAGYSCFGKNARPVHPFNRAVFDIDIVEDEDE